jgi:hypothetical protein
MISFADLIYLYIYRVKSADFERMSYRLRAYKKMLRTRLVNYIPIQG